MSNKKIGESFEQELLEILKENNFWATKLKEKETGGPFDIVATKNNLFISIEAKNLNNKTKFPKERIEPNQINSYERLCEVNSNKNSFFAFKTKEGIFFIPSEKVINCNEKSLEVITGIPLYSWLKLF